MNIRMERYLRGLVVAVQLHDRPYPISLRLDDAQLFFRHAFVRLLVSLQLIALGNADARA